MRHGRRVSRPILLLTIAGLLAACDSEEPGPLTGTWSGRVLLANSSGVPSVDSAAASTITMALRQENSRLSGTVQGVPNSPAGIDGVAPSDSVGITFFIGGDPALDVGGFAGRVAGDSLVGVFRPPSPSALRRPMIFHRLGARCGLTTV